MAELMLEPRIAAIANRNKITADDVLYLRRNVYQDGMSSRMEVENLFALDGAAQDKASEWAVFLIEAACDYVVHNEKPEGYLSEANASWLQGLITRDGRVERHPELELMVRVMEAARSVPAAFNDFVLAQVYTAIVKPDGVLFVADSNGQMRVSSEAAAMVRRVLHAAGGQGNIAITRTEAELLFNINDQAGSASGNPEWNDLFVKAIANFMMAASGYQAQSREKALAQDEFLNSAGTSGLGGFFSRMVEGALSGRNDWMKDSSIEDRFAERNAEFDRENSIAQNVTGEEVRWLSERISNDGKMGANERALVEFIKADAPALHPDFQKLIDKVA
ncbi:MAG: hypothetical protein WCC66_08360 [Rhizobiaceae bacterium]